MTKCNVIIYICKIKWCFKPKYLSYTITISRCTADKSSFEYLVICTTSISKCDSEIHQRKKNRHKRNPVCQTLVSLQIAGVPSWKLTVRSSMKALSNVCMHAEMVLIDNNWCTVQNARQVDVCDGWRRTLTHRRRHLCAVGSSFTRLSAKRCQNVAIYSAMSSGQNECTFVFVSVRTTAVSHRRVVQQTAAVRNRAAENNVNLHILISSCWWSLRGGCGRG